MSKHALVGNAGDSAQVAAARETEKIRLEREANELRAVLATPDGLRVVWRILTICRLNALSFEPRDPYTTAFYEGHRNVGNHLLADVFAVDPTAYGRMQADNERLKALRVPVKKRREPVSETTQNQDEDDGN